MLTKMGANLISRMGASFMSAADLSDWVAKGDEDCVRIAQTQAADRQALLALKQGLRVRQQAWLSAAQDRL